MLYLDEIRPIVNRMLEINMGLKKGEKVLLLNDVPNLKNWDMAYEDINDLVSRSLLAKKLYYFIKEVFKCNTVDYLVYPSTNGNGAEIPNDIASKLTNYDVIIAITTYSLTHTRARENASNNGVRIASMPGFEIDMLMPNSVMDADYNIIAQRTIKMSEKLTEAKTARVTTRHGSDITFSIKNRTGRASTGLFINKCDSGNLPGAEAYIAPVERTANGKIVIPAGWHPNLKEEMELEFNDGYASSITGGGEVGLFYKNILCIEDKTKNHRRNCAELGIGTNDKAKKRDNVLESEKILGTVHIAVGDNSHLGGFVESDIHEDFVLSEPTLYLDNIAVIKDGKWLI